VFENGFGILKEGSHKNEAGTRVQKVFDATNAQEIFEPSDLFFFSELSM
jgi:hypothetical protein